MMWRLPKTTGKVFRAYMNGLKHEQLAKEFGISVGTSKWHVSQAIDMLRKLIKR